MDFRDEVRVGQHTYGVTARGEPAQDDQPATVAVEFTGADGDGRVVAEGNLLVTVDGLADASAFLTRTLGGLAALHGEGRGRPGSRPRPPNAGQRWAEADGERLRERWMRGDSGESASRLL